MIKVPYNASAKNLLNNKVFFPAGLRESFRRLSLNFKSAVLSGKSGIANIAAAALADIKD